MTPRPGIGGEIFVRLRLFFPIEVVRRRDGEFGELRQLGLPDDDDAARLGIIERTEQHGIDDGENRGAGADTERESEDGNGGEARSFDELAKRVAEIV